MCGAYHIGYCVNGVTAAIASGLGLTGWPPGNGDHAEPGVHQRPPAGGGPRTWPGLVGRFPASVGGHHHPRRHHPSTPATLAAIIADSETPDASITVTNQADFRVLDPHRTTGGIP